MTDNLKIDLHIHSRVSDGTDTPVEILARIREKGIGIFSISDHDAVMGCLAVTTALEREQNAGGELYFINGVEFNCRDEMGRYHILGYGYDQDGVSINSLVDKGHEMRMAKTTDRMEALAKNFGFTFPEEEIKALLANDNPGKPHIGNLMVKYGYAATKEEAIDKYINKCRIRKFSISPEEAIKAILDSNGIPVLAHPSYGNGEDLIVGQDMVDRLQHLLPYGLMGLEAYYSGFTSRLQESLLELADRNGLYVTAGSDYHGKNKLVPLGDTNLEDISKAADGLHRFLNDVSMIKA